MHIVYLLLTGLAAGVLSGIFGIGGGVALVPILVLLLRYPQATASGISLVALLAPVGALGAWEYYRNGKIGADDLKSGLLIALGLFVGAFFGARLAAQLPETVLRRAFALFLAFVAIRMWVVN